MSKKVWFGLQPVYSPDVERAENSPVYTYEEFFSLQPDSRLSEGSDLTQISFTTASRHTISSQSLSQYTMEQDKSQETHSAYDSQEISSSQQESTLSEGHSAGDDGNSTSSLHETEAINSAIMEVSGELVQGLFSPHKHLSGGSESSDISDDDIRQGLRAGSIARYPESSTGLSDNDWNPYATESDTNQTPRSPRSNASDDRVGFISKASINVVAPSSERQRDVVATVSKTTGQMTVGTSGDAVRSQAEKNGEKLDILKYMIENEDRPDRGVEYADLGKTKRDAGSSRLKADDDDGRRESAESGRTVTSNGSRISPSESTRSAGTQDTRRESGESARSSNTGGTKSNRESLESAATELERSGETARSARHSMESQHSARSEGSQGSELSRKSQKSTGRESDRSERLDRLSNATDDNLKGLIEFEAAQRGNNLRDNDQGREQSGGSGREQSGGSGRDEEAVTRTRLTARLEPYQPSSRLAGTSDSTRNAVGSTGYISVAEREKLLSESPDLSQQLTEEYDRRQGGLSRPEEDRYRQPAPISREPRYKITDTFVDRSPSEISMRRVSNLFEETKKQVREAVSFPRPEPSGSEERFPLKDRLTWNPHDDSLMARDGQNKPGGREDFSREDTARLVRDSEVTRSLTSEEVARVLGKYSENEDKGIATSTPVVSANNQPAHLVSAFDRIEHETRGDDDKRTTPDVSDDEISRKVQAILARSEELGIGQKSQRHEREEYVPRSIDYCRLEKDLEEIQGNLHDVPRPTANDSMPMLSRTRADAASAASDPYRSLESTCTATLGRESGASEFATLGRESGASEYGRRLAWDHGADLDYDPTYAGQFLGTMTSTETTDTLSQRLSRLGADSDNLVVRPDSATTNDTENDAAEFDTLGTKTLTGSDISRAEKLVEQVMSRHAEGDLKESVEDIIAKYRNERKDLLDRFQHDDPASPEDEREHVPQVAKAKDVDDAPFLGKGTALQKTPMQPLNGKRDGSGLAERVYKILTSDQNEITNPDNVEKGMAKEVCRILTQERPQHQVNGILSEAMAEEHEMLKKLATQPKDDSSMDDSGVNESEVSFGLDDRAVRKQLEYSAMSSPEKGERTGVSDMTDIRHMTSAPYTAVSNAKSLLSSQLKKMSERNFDKTVELRTPYRQVIDCYPVYEVERQEPVNPVEDREAWMPRPLEAIRTSGKDKALSSERFYLTDKDRAPRGSHDPDSTESHRTRTRSDPFDLSPSRRGYQEDNRAGHTRSRSEEATSDLGHHFVSRDGSCTDRRAASSPRSFMGVRKKDDDWNTPSKHVPKEEQKQMSEALPAKPKDWSCECYTSLSDSGSLPRPSDTSSDSSWQYNRDRWTRSYEGKPSTGSKYSTNSGIKYSTNSGIKYNTNTSIKYNSKSGVSHATDISSSVKYRNGGKENYNKQKTESNYSKDQSPRQQSAFHPFGLKPTQGQGLKSKRVTLVQQLDKPGSPTKGLKHERPSRSRERSGKGKRVKICEPDKMSNSLPGYYPGHGYVESVPFNRDDVYELLSRSLAQEKKLAELQAKLFDGDSSPGRSPTANHGYTANFMSPNRSRHKSYEPQQEGSLSESETSGSRKAARPRPYRPMGTRDVYYTESGDDTNESGTTVESSHPGSDDAMPPYIPRHFLGSRSDVQRSQERLDNQLPVVDEHTARGLLRQIFASQVQTERGEVTSSKPGGRNDDVRQSGGQLTRTNPVGRASDPSGLQRESGLDTGYQSRTCNSDRDDNQGTRQSGQLERPGFRTREEFERDFAQRERELREEMHRRLSERQSDQHLGASVRSDPGGMLEDGGSNWEYRDMDDSQEFKLLQPEPAYPRERLRCSRSKSDTNLLDISPNESQKYSSPMQPGTRFLELSTQPSPIFGHQDSLTIPARRAQDQGSHQQPPELPRVPLEMERGASEDRRRGPSPLSTVEPVRPLEPGHPSMRSADREPVRPLEPGEGTRPIDCMGPVDLGADPRSIPQELRRTQREPRSLSSDERSRSPSAQRSRSPAGRRSKSPMQERQKEMEKQLESLNQQLNDQVKEIREDQRGDEQFEDQFPPSKKAQVLREVLEQEYNDKLPANINDMWTRFQTRRDQSVSESSLNSTRLDALSGLLQDPTSHAVNSFVKTKQDNDRQKQWVIEEKSREKEMSEEKMLEDQQREREKLEKELKAFEEKAAEERSQRRQELRQRHGLSEEESNGSYQEILLEKSRKKEKKRSAEKKRESPKGEQKERRKKTPEKIKADIKARGNNKENEGKLEKGSSTDIKHRTTAKMARSHPNDSIDTLFSIPEDASFEQSPSKVESEMRARQRRHRHVIDPLMSKLRDKIKLQRVKIDKERRKELQRTEKLKKLEMLLKAKTKGKLSDMAIDVELQNVSSTTSVSPSEPSSFLFSDSTIVSTALESDGSTPRDTTAMKDSTVDTIKLQVKKYAMEKFASPKKAFIDTTDTTESSDFSNIVVERIPEKREKSKEGKRAGSKGKKIRVDEFGNRIRKEKKSKRSKDEYNTAELMGEEKLTRQARGQYQSPDRLDREQQMSSDRRRTSPNRHQYQSPDRLGREQQLSSDRRRSSPDRRQYQSPERLGREQHESSDRRRLSPSRHGRLMQDACTMYPSPITVSPPSRRRLREVLMKSEAIQTSPSVRSTSPSYSYDEAPVAPVPLMSQKASKKTSRRVASASPPRHAQTSTSTRKTSKSPSNSGRSPVASRKRSSSPIGRSAGKSCRSPLRHNMPRKTVNNPMWKPESESPPPDNSMFTPEDENTLPMKEKEDQATTWFIPMKPAQPWRQPLKERQAFSVRQEAWQPSSVSQSTWKDIMHGEVLKDRGDPNDVSRDTKFDLDPQGQPIRDEDTLTDEDEDLDQSKSKHLGKMTLQEAFQVHRQTVISRLRQRQKRLNLAAEQRKMEVFLKQERDKLFHEERRKEANPEAHPYSDNLYKPARRTISKDEMKEMALKKYKKLPEVVKQEQLKKRQEDYSLNRLRARLFNRKMQRKVLQQADKWGR